MVFLHLAKEGEHPRAYEVAGQLIKTVSEVSQNLLDLQEKLKKIKDVPNTGPKSVTNALFVGSTTELTKLLKKKNKWNFLDQRFRRKYYFTEPPLKIDEDEIQEVKDNYC